MSALRARSHGDFSAKKQLLNSLNRSVESPRRSGPSSLSPIAPNYFIPEWLSTSNFHICLRFLGYVYTASGLSNYDGLKQRLPAGLFGPFQTDAKFPRAE